MNSYGNGAQSFESIKKLKREIESIVSHNI